MSIDQQAPRGDNFQPVRGKEIPGERERIAKIDRVTLGDLEAELYAINEQLPYWENVRQSAQAQIVAAKGRINAARHVLAKTSDGGQQDRYDRKLAHSTIEDAVTKLEFAEKRKKNAEIQLKTWNHRKKDFPTDKLKKLRQEAKLREQMSGRASGARTEFAESF